MWAVLWRTTCGCVSIPRRSICFRILRGFYRLCGGFALLFAGGTVRMSLCVRGGASLSRRHAERKRHATRYKDPFSALPLFRRGQGKWLERSGRLDFDNLCVVMQAAELDEGLLERFERLPISRKVILGYETLPLQSPSISRCVRWILSCRAGSWIITVCRVGVISTISITSHFSTTEPFERKIAPPRRNSATDSGV